MTSIERLSRILIAAALGLTLTACASSGRNEAPEPTEEAAGLNTQLGMQYLAAGQLDQAQTKLEKAIELDPKMALAHSSLALIYDQKGDTERAGEHHRKALRYAEDDDPAMANNYGIFLCRHGQYEEAAEYLLRAARNRRYSTPAAAYANAGVCAKRGGDVAAAEAHFRRALDINPNFPDALWQMVRLSSELERPLQTRGFLARLEQVATLSAAALWIGVRAEWALGDEQAADGYARRLRREFPTAPETQALIEAERERGDDS